MNAPYGYFFFLVFFLTLRFAFLVFDALAAAADRVLRRLTLGMDLIPCRLQEAPIYRKFLDKK